jgi:hypothetical protein
MALGLNDTKQDDPQPNNRSHAIHFTVCRSAECHSANFLVDLHVLNQFSF